MQRVRRFLPTFWLLLAFILGVGSARLVSGPIVLKFFVVVPPLPEEAAGHTPTASRCFYGNWRKLDHCQT